MSAPKRRARIAGFLYLALAAFGAFAHLYARSTVHVPGDAAATAGNLVAHAGLFRVAFVADLLMATIFVFLGLALYRLLAPVHREVAAAMVMFVTVGAGMILVNLLFHFAALLVATDPGYASALGAGGSNALTLLLLDMHQHGYAIAGTFFGLWLLPLGYLVYASELFPRSLGGLLMIACLAYLVETVARFLFPGLGPVVFGILAAPSSIAEFWMIGYLLAIGVRAPRPAGRLRVAA